MKKRIIGMILVGALLAGCGSGAAQTGGSARDTAARDESGLLLTDVESGTLTRAEEKEETVSVRTSADGTPRETRVRVRLSGSGKGDYIEDITNLSEIRNREGDENFLMDGNRLIWEDHGEEINYEGKSDAELPFDIRISYYLNGESIAPEALAGKSGEVRIRFEYENKTTEKRKVENSMLELPVPMTAISMALLPEDVFSDVEVKNGKLVNFAGQNLAVGIAMPGVADALALSDFQMTEEIEIPDYVEINARVEKFKLDFTATIVSPGLLSGTGEDGNNTEESADDLFEDVKKLEDAGTELTDGSEELASGAEEFGDGLNRFADGVSSLVNGASTLSGGANTLSAQSAQLSDGAKQLADGLDELRDALSLIDTAQLDQLSTIDVDALSSALSAVDLSGLESMVREALGDEAAAQIGNLSATLAQLRSSLGGLSQIPAAAGQLSQTASALQSGIRRLSSGASSLSAGINSYTGGVSQLASGASQLSSGATRLSSAGKELKEGYRELQDGILKLRDGVAEFNEDGIRELANLIRVDLKNIVDRLRAVRDLDAEYNNFSGIFEGQKGEVRFIFESDEI